MNIEALIDAYGSACSEGNEYDNRRRIAETRAALLTAIRKRKSAAESNTEEKP